MKKVLLGFLLLVSSLAHTQTNFGDRNLNVTATTLRYGLNTPRTPYVNLNLGTPNYYNQTLDKKTAFDVIFISGIGFMTASLLENSYPYGTYQNSSSYYNSTYVQKPFWQQTPRQIMFCVGVGFTLVGGIGMVKAE